MAVPSSSPSLGVMAGDFVTTEEGPRAWPQSDFNAIDGPAKRGQITVVVVVAVVVAAARPRRRPRRGRSPHCWLQVGY